MASIRLTDQQLALFDTLGYLYFPGLLADCVDKIIDEFEAVWRAHGGGHHGHSHDGQQRSCIFPFLDRSEYFSSLLDDPRIHDIAAGICGDDFNYTSGDGNLGCGQGFGHRWHQFTTLAFLAPISTPSSGDGERRLPCVA